MNRNNRLVLLGLAAIVLIVAVIVIGTGGDDEPKSGSQARSTPAGTETPAEPTSTATSKPTAAPTPEPPVRVVVKGKKPVGGVKEIKVDKGDEVRFNVTSDETENVHLHGYDVEKPVGPGRPARFDFKADIDGIFEVELEESAVQIVSLRVNP